MDIHLKEGEHVRITHDAHHEGVFRVFMESGLIHVTAMKRQDIPQNLVVTEDPVSFSK